MKKLGLKGIEKHGQAADGRTAGAADQRASILAGDITYIQERGTRPRSIRARVPRSRSAICAMKRAKFGT
jgi:hypothetical protein